MELEKSSWNSLIEEMKKGVAYLGSINKDKATIEGIVQKLNSVDCNSLYIDRTYVSGSSVIKLLNDKNTFSYLDKKGKVFKYKSFYIIDSQYCIVVYGIVS